MTKTPRPTVASNKEFEIFALQGNQIAVLSCNEIIFPGQHDYFIILNDVMFPNEERLESITIPKHLILMIKTRSKEKKSNLRVLSNA